MLREAGMSGTGIKEIVARSGAPIGSLYHYFPGGKTQLVTESLRMHAERVPRLMEHFFDGRKTAAAALRAPFNAASEGFERGGANKGCALGAVTLDLMPLDTEIRDVCRQAFDRWVAMIAAQLPFSDKRSRRSFAVVVVAALEGAFILARAAQSGEPFRDAGEWLAQSLRRTPRFDPLVAQSPEGGNEVSTVSHQCLWYSDRRVCRSKARDRNYPRRPHCGRRSA